MSSNSIIAQPYAQAWFECAQGAADIETYGEVLEFFSRCIKTAEVAKFLQDPTLDSTAHLDLLKQAWQQALATNNINEKLQQQVPALLDLLSSNLRLMIFPAMAHRFHEMQIQHQGKSEVTVKLPFATTDEVKSSLDAALKKYYADAGDINYVTDKNVLGGVKIHSKDHVVDFSAVDQLKKLAQQMEIKNYQPLTERG